MKQYEKKYENHAEKKLLEEGIKMKEEKEPASENLNYETILMKQIEYALGKEETPSEILKIIWIGLIIGIIIFGISILFFVFFIMTKNELENNLNITYLRHLFLFQIHDSLT